jgi:hypothetical protein
MSQPLKLLAAMIRSEELQSHFGVARFVCELLGPFSFVKRSAQLGLEMVTHGKAPTGGRSSVVTNHYHQQPYSLTGSSHVPDTLEQRQRLGYTGMVFLIPDGFSGHVRNATKEVRVCYGIRMLAIPSHTSNPVQPLDLDLFALYKSESRRVQPHLDLNTQATRLIRMLSGFQTAATAVNVIAGFWRAGIVS